MNEVGQIGRVGWSKAPSFGSTSMWGCSRDFGTAMDLVHGFCMNIVVRSICTIKNIKYIYIYVFFCIYIYIYINRDDMMICYWE